MTSFIFTSGTSAPQTLVGGELGIIGAAATVSDASGGGAIVGVAAAGQPLDLIVHGQVYSLSATAIGFGGGLQSITIGATGIVSAAGAGAVSSSGIFMSPSDSGSSLVNFGQIIGNSRGISIQGGATTPFVLVQNAGTVSADGTALALVNPGSARIDNSGSMIGQEYGIYSGQSFAVELANTGLIRGRIEALHLGDQADIVRNEGRIEGLILLGAGDDRFDTRGGVVVGDILCGDGNDTFLGNAAAAETFDGGIGTDEVDFRQGPAVTVALDGSLENDGGALGDLYLNVERVIGSVRADVIRGNAQANQLLGQAGADSLDGAAGADLIRGGQGLDTLTGGLGNDSFRFQSLAEFGDQITDFGNIAGNDDRFQILASALDAGLSAGALAASQFRSRADNAAQDADDRFIFRTTDRTLWFDADGNGAGAAVLVADLQAGAVVTAADIQLI